MLEDFSKRHNDPGYRRERLVARMNRRRDAWAHPLGMRAEMIATADRLMALHALMDEIDPVPGLQSVAADPEPGALPPPLPEVQLTKEIWIGRHYDPVLGHFRWCTNEARMPPFFDSTSAMVAYAVLTKMDPVGIDRSARIAGAVRRAAGTALFSSPEQAEALALEVCAATPGMMDDDQLYTDGEPAEKDADLNKAISAAQAVQVGAQSISQTPF